MKILSALLPRKDKHDAYDYAEKMWDAASFVNQHRHDVKAGIIDHIIHKDKHWSDMNVQSNKLHSLTDRALNHPDQWVDNETHASLSEQHKAHAKLADDLAKAHRTTGNQGAANHYSSMARSHIEAASAHDKYLKSKMTRLGKAKSFVMKHPGKLAIGAVGAAALSRAYLNRNKD